MIYCWITNEVKTMCLHRKKIKTFIVSQFLGIAQLIPTVQYFSWGWRKSIGHSHVTVNMRDNPLPSSLIRSMVDLKLTQLSVGKPLVFTGCWRELPVAPKCWDISCSSQSCSQLGCLLPQREVPERVSKVAAKTEGTVFVEPILKNKILLFLSYFIH